MAADLYRLTVRMKGPVTARGDVRFEDFLKFLFDLLATLHATDRAVARSDEPTMDYRVRDLQHNSPATIVLEARPRERKIDLRKRVLQTFVSGVNGVLKGGMPIGFKPGLLLDFQDLAKHLNGRRLREASFEHATITAKVTTAFKEQIEQIVGPDRHEHGTVSGKLDIVNAHQAQRFFWLYPAGSTERIRCYFPPTLMGRVGEAIERHITVSGRLRFKATMLQPYAVSVSDIDIHERDDDLPSLRNLRGLTKDATPAPELSEQFVRRQRDAW